MEFRNGICAVRWHGRGGQGAISSAQILAQAAFLCGYRGVTSAPSFGAERRGAPVTASTRLSREPIRVFSQIERPDIVVVLDETLLVATAPMDGLAPDGWLIVNSGRDLGALGLTGEFAVAAANATAVAREIGLLVAGVPMVNTAMLGAVARSTGIVSLDSVRDALAKRFPPAQAEKNFEAAFRTAESTKVLHSCAAGA